MSAEVGWQCNSGLVEGSERVQADEDGDIESDEDYDDVDDIDEDDE